MLNKRLVGVVTVRNGWAVQSIGYRRYLPLGRPEIACQNLDRWGADEIVLQVIDRSTNGSGPHLALLERVATQRLSTPLIYGGGIRNANDAVAVIAAGADRVLVDAIIFDDPAAIPTIAERLGSQAVIAALPVSAGLDGVLHLNYRTGDSQRLSSATVEAISSGSVAEVLIIDWQNEGKAGGFDERLLDQFAPLKVNAIAFGGLSEAAQLRRVLQREHVAAAAVGNFLSYREHAIRKLKLQLGGLPLRAPPHHRTSPP